MSSIAVYEISSYYNSPKVQVIKTNAEITNSSATAVACMTLKTYYFCCSLYIVSHKSL